ncbi:GNAT family N-acetyltransferase [Microbulbifer yueqingensis]|uniref:Ribosomal protein S18 acetylase RimI n=1 Tax=Microbulbifer yueqingensis TaxID=658219 RepID=A0A1G9DBS5_9GAMM|nr:GNAT family N-acetyltransferase [Microbulbifer yueqingensis]SDK61346.1 Ribosomal protein S18 acetylase RimI [Microbulbifer yueqingensis]
MEIVPTREDDWESLKKIRLESLRDSPDAFGITYGEANSLNQDQWQLIASEESSVKFLIARCGGCAIGLIGGVYANGECELTSMWVSPASRRSNVGSRLVEALLDHALSEGCGRVTLKVSDNNKPAFKLYLKMGFEFAGEAGVLKGNKTIKLKNMVWHAASRP